MTTTRIWVCAVLLGAIGIAGGARAADPKNPNWPCVQPKVPVISAGQVWAGPPIDEQDQSWRDDPAVQRLVQELAPRRVPLEDAYKKIDAYAAGLETEVKTKALSLLFAGLLHTINTERTEIINGIERYAQKQKALARDIRAKTSEMDALLSKTDPTESEREKQKKLEEDLNWQTRIFDEREHSLRYVCESPVLLEKRIFELSRHLMAQLDQ